MDDNNQQKWYFKTRSIVISFLLIGPFMLPLVWANPRFSKKVKVIISLTVIILTCLLILISINSLKSIGSNYQLFLNQI